MNLSMNFEEVMRISSCSGDQVAHATAPRRVLVRAAVFALCALTASAKVVLAFEHLGLPAETGVYNGDTLSYFRGRAVVQFSAEVDMDSATAILATYDAEANANGFFGDYLWIRFDTLKNVIGFCDSLENHPDIERAWPDPIATFPSYTNDPYFSPTGDLPTVDLVDSCDIVQTEFLYQWYLHFDSCYSWGGMASDSCGLLNHATHLRVRPAWDITKGDTSIKILNLDTGVDHVDGEVTHEDMDSDHVKVGRNYLFHSPDTLARSGATAYHGNPTIGIISATHGNGKGIAGIAPNCVLIGATAGGSGALTSALFDACSLGVDVVTANLCASVRPDSLLRLIETGVKAAAEHDILVVGAHCNGDNVIFAPAVFAFYDSANGTSGGYPNVASVNAMNQNGAARYYHTVDTGGMSVIAPGQHQSIVSTSWCPTRYARYQATSAATPMVVGVAALILSHYDDIGGSEALDILQRSADKIWRDPSVPDTFSTYEDSAHHPAFGWGRPNAFRALNGWYGTVDSCDTSWSRETLYAGDNRVYIADLTIDSSLHSALL